MFKIGHVEISNRVVAAPMAGVSDRAYRHMAQLFGCGLIFSEMISDMGLIYGQAKTRQLAERSGDEPLALQIFGSQLEPMVKGAQILEELGEVDVLFVPVGGVFTIDGAQAQDLVKQIGPKVAIPMHFRVGGLSMSIQNADGFLKDLPEEESEGKEKTECPSS